MSVRAGLGIILWLVISSPGLTADRELAVDSTLEGVLRRGELRVGFESGYMPFEMIDKRSGLRERDLRAADVRHGAQRASFIGFDIDIAREMAKALGVRYVPVHTQWTSIVPALNLGRFDIIISGMSVTAERQERVDFSDPYMTIGQTILLAARHAESVASFRDLDDAAYVVASKPGTTGEEAINTLMPNATYKPFSTEAEGAMAVVSGEADAFVYDLPFNAVFMAMQDGADIEFLDEPFTSEYLAWGIRKDDPDFREWLNQFLAEIKADGRYDRIYQKWFKRRDWFAYVR